MDARLYRQMRPVGHRVHDFDAAGPRWRRQVRVVDAFLRGTHAASAHLLSEKAGTASLDSPDMFVWKGRVVRLPLRLCLPEIRVKRKYRNAWIEGFLLALDEGLKTYEGSEDGTP
jgi:hypothetical protein